MCNSYLTGEDSQIPEFQEPNKGTKINAPVIIGGGALRVVSEIQWTKEEGFARDHLVVSDFEASRSRKLNLRIEEEEEGFKSEELQPGSHGSREYRSFSVRE
ncbi:hypothetical protein FH972_019617 [Carpinus fangiana]|uniref:Uncharacterized protein n=1 Tax=Carpinus fangiana TaxID=176857 RepID=A0A5N6RTM6_9ROSI|nr:hypothetical protein FH972_019617 [Carpinus fangiana]